MATLRERFARHVIACAVLLMLASVPATADPTAAIFEPASEGKGELVVERGVAILHLRGTPHAMGLQHGKILKRQINALINGYLMRALRGPKGHLCPQGNLAASSSCRY